MITTPTPDALRAALAGRQDHAALCALTTRPLKRGIGVYWRDDLAHESGSLGILPHDACPEVYAALVEALKEWRES